MTSPIAPERIHVVVTGAMGVGKSTTAAALAIRLGRPLADSDVDIERLAGMSGADFCDRHGLDALHELEAAVLIGALARDIGSVIGAAASTIENHLVRLLMPGRALVVRLELGMDDTLRRQTTGRHRRPMTRDELAALEQRRRPLYDGIVDLTVNAESTPGDLVDAIGAGLGA